MQLKIKTHTSEEYTTTVEVYDPVVLNEQINNKDLNTVVIGDVIISRIDIKNVVPVTEEAL